MKRVVLRFWMHEKVSAPGPQSSGQTDYVPDVHS